MTESRVLQVVVGAVAIWGAMAPFALAGGSPPPPVFEFGGSIGNQYALSPNGADRYYVKAGFPVYWQRHWSTQESFATHPLVSDDGAFEDVEVDNPNGSSLFSHVYDDPGVYNFHCRIHDGMRGTVEVWDGTPPSVTIDATPATVEPGQPVTLEATVTDPDGDAITSVWWDRDGDNAPDEPAGQPATELTTTATFDEPGDYDVRILVKDARNAYGYAITTIHVAAAPEPQPTPTPEPQPTPTPEPQAPPIDTRAPVVSVLAAPASRTSSVLRAGHYVAKIRTDEAGYARATLRTETGKVLAKAARIVPTGATNLKLKLTKAGRRALRKARRALNVTFKLQVTDAAENTSRTTSRLTLRN